MVRSGFGARLLLMIGVIVGEISGALLFMIVGGIYFLVTGKQPISYVYFPR